MNLIPCSLLHIWTVASVSAVNSCTPTFGCDRQRRRLLNNTEKSAISWSAAGKPTSGFRTGVFICPTAAISPVKRQSCDVNIQTLFWGGVRRQRASAHTPLKSLRHPGIFFLGWCSFYRSNMASTLKTKPQQSNKTTTKDRERIESESRESLAVALAEQLQEFGSRGQK